MDQDAKQQIARFRFGVIADLVGHRKPGRGEKRRILNEKTQAVWEIPFSPRTRISISTILLWLRRYETSVGKLESLYPDERADKNHTRALDEETAATLVRLKKEFRGATVPSILREAKARRILPPDFRVSMATLYRFFHRQGLGDDDAPPVDRRRFQAWIEERGRRLAGRRPELASEIAAYVDKERRECEIIEHDIQSAVWLLRRSS